jgi:hypothetical protein
MVVTDTNSGGGTIRIGSSDGSKGQWTYIDSLSTTYFDYAQTLKIRSLTGGTNDRLVLTSAGNVGIGGSPLAKFEILKNATGGRWQFVDEGADVYNALNIRNNANTAFLPLLTRAAAFTWNVNGADRMVLDSNGTLSVTNNGTITTTLALRTTNQNNYLALFAGAAMDAAGEISFQRNGVNDGNLFYGGNASGQHIWRSGGYTTRMVLDGLGNLGIGTTTPVNKLDVEGAVILANGAVSALKPNAIFADYFSAGSTNRIFALGPNNSTGGALLLGTASANASVYSPTMTLTSGNVGIGTTAPGAKLSIQSDSIYNSEVGTLRLETATDTNKRMYLGYDKNLNAGYLQSQQAGTNWTPTIINPNGGNVGIGTTNPQAKLQVGDWTLFKSGSWSAPATPGTTSVGERIVFYQDTGWKTAIGMDVQNGIWFQAHTPGGQVAYQWFTGANAAAPVEKMRIMENGNVGIGTTSPTHKLSVKGTIRAQEIIVDNTNWADYVFEEDYRLAPLAEVESHIKARKHLPGIPSAAEVAEHGVSMGDMQAKLLSKVEELTLHLIAQEKAMKAMQTAHEFEITSLRQQISGLKTTQP